MAEYRHLARAPITEALIDFRIQGQADASAIEDALRGNTGLGYQRVGPIFNSALGVSFNPEESNAAVSTQPIKMLGARLHSPDQRYVAQFSIEGFTLSRLPPYETWGTLLAEARRIWPIFVGAARPTSIARVATRFINELQLPLKPGEDFEDFLTTKLLIPDPAFSRTTGYLLRYETIDSEADATIICTQVLRPSDSGRASVIVDIDAFAQRRFEVVGDSAWGYLRQLRDIKNRVFFNLITEKCAELYE
jgi:uncharacterized protein (TIGR04255 family)